MSVTSVTSYAASSSTSEAKSTKNSELSTESFFKLIAAQLQNQDMSNPTSNSEMMTQMTQIAMMQAMDSFSNSMDDFSKVNTINYGTSMMGKEVLVATTGKNGELVNKTGTVNRVDIYNGVPTIYLNDDTTTGYPIANIMSVYQKGHDPTNTTVTDDNIDTETDSTTDDSSIADDNAADKIGDDAT
jgi:flagellar basal-body rod modification protein FlgD